MSIVNHNTAGLLTCAEAIRSALQWALAEDDKVYLIGLGVPDPGGIFGTTRGLQNDFGDQRVMDMPCAENGMTGIAIGSALGGMRPVMTHQRVDFFLLAMEQLVNQAAKWHYMFNGQAQVPITIRLVVGRGWGQGPQHSQSLHAWFAHIPGLKVVMPATAADAHGLLLSSIFDENPVVFIEHRWIHGLTGNVTPGERIPLGTARVAQVGGDVSIVSSGYMVIESLRAAEFLVQRGISAEVIDLRTLRPLDEATVLKSVRKTGRLVAADLGANICGQNAEICALCSEQAFDSLKSAPIRVGFPDAPVPTAPSLAAEYYPRWTNIVNACLESLRLPLVADFSEDEVLEFDKPDPTFTGPF